MKDILFRMNINPSGSCNTRFSSIETVPVATTGVESLEGSSTLPAEVEDFSSYVAGKGPNGLSPTPFG